MADADADAGAAAPAEPVTLDDAKRQCQVDGSDFDVQLAGMIAAARDAAERASGLILTARAVEETGPLGPFAELAAWPVTSIDAVTIADASGSRALDPGQWWALTQRRPVRVRPKAPGWGGLAGAEALVTVRASAGFASPDLVPPSVKAAILMIVGHLFANRAAVTAGDRAAAVSVPLAVDMLERFRLDYV